MDLEARREFHDRGTEDPLFDEFVDVSGGKAPLDGV